MNRFFMRLGMLLVAGVASLPAQSINTGTSAIGTTDPNWVVSWTAGPDRPPGNSGGFYDAFVVADVPGVWQPDSAGTGTKWISAWPNSTGPFGGAPYFDVATGANNRYIYTFAIGFLSADPGLLLFRAGWDNLFASVALNGVSYDPASLLSASTDQGVDDHSGFCRNLDGDFNTSDYPHCVATFEVPGIVAGMNTMSFELHGDGQTDGLWVALEPPSGSIPAEIIPEPGVMSLLATGLVGLMGAGVKRRVKRIV